jgi:hypothetical protein
MFWGFSGMPLIRTTRAKFAPVHRTADGNRLDLPRQFTDFFDWLKWPKDEDVEVDGWLVAVDTGRYRLVSDEQVCNDEKLAPIRLLLLEGPSDDPAAISFARSSLDSAQTACLIPVRATPHKDEWRITWPWDFDALAPDDCNPDALSIMFSLEGYCEIWYTDLLRKNGTIRRRKRS